jgi:hypothetical protein
MNATENIQSNILPAFNRREITGADKEIVEYISQKY